MLRASRTTSPARGPKSFASGIEGGGTWRPVRSARVHAEIWAIGRVTALCTITSAMSETTDARTTKCRAYLRQTPHSATERCPASSTTASAPTTRSSRWSGAAYTYRFWSPSRRKPLVTLPLTSASVTSGNTGGSAGVRSGVASSRLS